ncbi:MAG TPA: DUF5989 family protein [Thermoanaerobaculia bacterium]|nr:DUF5989 family protein [Thermoanaerobaculia bacterium]
MLPAETKSTPSSTDRGDFAAQAETATPGLARELWAFLADNKKWWLGPIVVVLLVVSLLLLAGGSAAPFIYALF